MQAAAPPDPSDGCGDRTRLLVRGIDAASAAALNSAQTETSADAGRFAPRMQADRQSGVIVTEVRITEPANRAHVGASRATFKSGGASKSGLPAITGGTSHCHDDG